MKQTQFVEINNSGTGLTALNRPVEKGRGAYSNQINV